MDQGYQLITTLYPYMVHEIIIAPAKNFFSLYVFLVVDTTTKGNHFVA